MCSTGPLRPLWGTRERSPSGHTAALDLSPHTLGRSASTEFYHLVSGYRALQAEQRKLRRIRRSSLRLHLCEVRNDPLSVTLAQPRPASLLVLWPFRGDPRGLYGRNAQHVLRLLCLFLGVTARLRIHPSAWHQCYSTLCEARLLRLRSRLSSGRWT